MYIHIKIHYCESNILNFCKMIIEHSKDKISLGNWIFNKFELIS